MNGKNLAIVILGSDVASTEMRCMAPEGVMEQEQACLIALASAASYRFAGAGLELLDAMGSVVMVCEPVPKQGPMWQNSRRGPLRAYLGPLTVFTLTET